MCLRFMVLFAFVFVANGCHQDDFDWQTIRHLTCESKAHWQDAGLHKILEGKMSYNQVLEFIGCLKWAIYDNTWDGSPLPFHTWITRREFNHCREKSDLMSVTLTTNDENFFIAYAISIGPHDVVSSFCASTD